MLRLILGKAGAGKTAAVMKEIALAVKERRGGQLLIVPEQYSHEAERELCAVCGDSLSLYGEALSFTGLARRVRAEKGGGAAVSLDKGGRLLCMARALNGLKLELYAAAPRRAELQAELLGAVDELKSACLTPEQLLAASWEAGGQLGKKLRELAVIYEAYDAVVSNGRADPADRLDRLAEQIAGGACGFTEIYVDGFTDFTGQEQRVLHALLKRGIDLTVCLTVDSLDGDNEVFGLSRMAARKLLASAEELGQEQSVEYMDRPGPIGRTAAFADGLFGFGQAEYDVPDGGISLFRAENIPAECELAAARALELVRDGGCRWRDIAVAVRGFEDYRGRLESTFSQYGVPLFTSRRSGIMSKPLPALISGAYDILQGGWDTDDVISYIRTGLTGLLPQEADELTDYIYKWQLRAAAWERDGDWKQHPDGYGAGSRESEEERLQSQRRLENINLLRRRIALPLKALRERSAGADTAEGQAAALAAFLEELELPQTLGRRSAELEAAGRLEAAMEYGQLWELTVNALEQCAAILGGSQMDMDGFSRLFLRMLSAYDTGVIPVALDRVTAGDFDRMRRRRIKHLIVLGCSDDRLPRAEQAGGVFSIEERERLQELNIELGAGDGELWREFSLIYNCLSLPSETLTMTYPAVDGEGGQLRPSFVFKRAGDMFGISAASAGTAALRLSAPGPALLLAAQSLRGGGSAERAAAEYFRERDPERLRRLEQAASLGRGSLSPEAAERLYGRQLRLSASRIEKFFSCRFAYFCRYGLNAKKYEPVDFAPPEMGTFMHYVLEKCAREVKDLGGFKAVDDKKIAEMTDRYIEEYIQNELDGFREKSARFVYIFRRLCAELRQVVTDMADELRLSDFEPEAFELDFSKPDPAWGAAPLRLGSGGERLQLTGVADRVDVWRKDGKKYVRVVDYKTGKKDFRLSDLWYGMNMQMLLYLMELTAGGGAVPAGIMYLPARDGINKADMTAGPKEAEKIRRSALRRKGFILDDPELREAWEHGEEKIYSPDEGRDRGSRVDSQGLSLLCGHIERLLTGMAGSVRNGSIAARPSYRSKTDNACVFCEYAQICRFADGGTGEGFSYMPALSAQELWEKLREEESEGGGGNE